MVIYPSNYHLNKIVPKIHRLRASSSIFQKLLLVCVCVNGSIAFSNQI